MEKLPINEAPKQSRTISYEIRKIILLILSGLAISGEQVALAGDLAPDNSRDSAVLCSETISDLEKQLREIYGKYKEEYLKNMELESEIRELNIQLKKCQWDKEGDEQEGYKPKLIIPSE